MSPVPWPLIGRTRKVPPIVQAARDMAGVPYTPPPPPPAPRRPIPAGTSRTPAYSVGWTTAEADVLDALAAAGGDLTAHRTVHLEDL